MAFSIESLSVEYCGNHSAFASLYRTRVTHRDRARRLVAWGIFPGAEVVRGRDWRWNDQDGETYTLALASNPAVPAFFRLQEKLGRLGSRLLLHHEGLSKLRVKKNTPLSNCIEQDRRNQSGQSRPLLSRD